VIFLCLGVVFFPCKDRRTKFGALYINWNFRKCEFTKGPLQYLFKLQVRSPLPEGMRLLYVLEIMIACDVLCILYFPGGEKSFITGLNEAVEQMN